MLDSRNRSLGAALFVFGLIGMVAALILSVEYLRIAGDDAYVASCDINSVVSCGSVLRTPSSAVVAGIPNALFGLAGFAALAAIGAALAAGGVFAGWFWFLIQAGMTAAVVFVHWMFVDSVFVLELLCPYCMVVWAVTIPAFVLVTASTVRTWGGSAGAGLYRWRWAVALLWVAAVAAVVIARNHAFLF